MAATAGMAIGRYQIALGACEQARLARAASRDRNANPRSAVPEPAQTRRNIVPSGTATFAFTDIEGNTRRWERDRSAMQAAVRRHDPLMRTAIADLLESTHVYACEKLHAAGEATLCAARHLRYLNELFGAADERQEQSGRYDEKTALFERELADVRAALDAALTRPDVIAGAQLCVNVGRAWELVALEAEGLARCKALVSQLPANEVGLRARVTLAQAQNSSNVLRLASRCFDYSVAALQYARQAGDARGLALALYSMLRWRREIATRRGRSSARGSRGDRAVVTGDATATPFRTLVY